MNKKLIVPLGLLIIGMLLSIGFLLKTKNQLVQHISHLEYEYALLAENSENTNTEGYTFYENLSDGGKYIVLENNVFLRAAPIDDADNLSTVSKGDILEVFASIFTPQNAEFQYWMLGRIEPYEVPSGNIGWIQSDFVAVYTVEMMDQARSHIKLTDDSVEYESGRPMSDLLENHTDYLFRIYDEQEDIVYISYGAGSSFAVKKEYLIYPEP